MENDRQLQLPDVNTHWAFGPWWDRRAAVTVDWEALAVHVERITGKMLRARPLAWDVRSYL